MHTPRCNHATGDIRDYAEAALKAGLDEIGMSDHSPMPDGFDPAWRMRRDELEDYLCEAESVRTAFAGRLTLRIGLEADFHPGSENYIAGLIAAHDWDFIIGSVHFIGDWGFDNPDHLDAWTGRDIEKAYCDYFDLVAASARCGLFDILGHPDLIKKFGHRPPPDSRRVRMAEEHMLQAVRQADVVLEISSAGLRKPVREIYPQQRIVRRAAELGIPFTYGSDAHAPEDVGHGMDLCLQALLDAGITEVATFVKRRRSMKRFVL
ncbi:MAG: histidinol-phosphatase HisJ family protein [Zetaproteobacteria bacterium]|nr:MAG: histidinol-phosphatase HisJ family protein [Zetaproteobacteria bacterium]